MEEQNTTQGTGNDIEKQSVDKDARNWGMLCHLAALCAFIGIPFGHILGPLLVWLIKKDEYPLVEEQGKEALNFQISMTIYTIISGVLIFVAIGIILLPALLVLNIALTIIAAVKTSEGETYRYPLTIRLLQ